MLSWNPFKKKPIIEFYCHRDDVEVLPQPKPAGKYMPEWYKKIPPLITMEEMIVTGLDRIALLQKNACQ